MIWQLLSDFSEQCRWKWQSGSWGCRQRDKTSVGTRPAQFPPRTWTLSFVHTPRIDMTICPPLSWVQVHRDSACPASVVQSTLGGSPLLRCTDSSSRSELTVSGILGTGGLVHCPKHSFISCLFRRSCFPWEAAPYLISFIVGRFPLILLSIIISYRDISSLYTLSIFI